MINPLDKQYLSTKNFKSNTNYLMDGDIFISLNGGHKYLDAESEKKISYIVLDETDKYKGSAKNIKCTGLNKNFYLWLDEIFEIDHASFENFFVTGTNGKTTTNYFLSKILLDNGLNHGSIGTLGTHINNDFIFQNQLTTEEPTYIRSFFRDCSKRNINKVLFEASSIGIDQKRLAGLPIKHAAYLNISRDHLDYHKTTENYLQSKLKLIEGEGLETLVYNYDQQEFKDIFTDSSAKNIFKISRKDIKADIFYKILDISEHGIVEFEVSTVWGKFQAKAPIISEFNVFNLLASLPYFVAIGGDVENFFDSVPNLMLPKGRLQKIKDKSIFIDYAHTPDAIEQACISIKKQSNTKLILVFGAGGDRDIGKRKLMGEIADKYADKIILTSDNPRGEDPVEIIDMISEGILNKTKIVIEHERSKAISYAIKIMDNLSVILVCGKGHETTQTIGQNIQYFSDEEEIIKCIS